MDQKKMVKINREKFLENIIRAVKKNWTEETLKNNFVLELARIGNWKTNPNAPGDPKTNIEWETYQLKKGRLDVLLKDGDIPRIVIECKRPTVKLIRNGILTEKGKEAMEQVHKYAQGLRYWRYKCLPNIMSIVTNGREIIWFDSNPQNFSECLKGHKKSIVDLKTLQKIIRIINVENVRKNDLKEVCKEGINRDEREAIKVSSTHLFSKICQIWLRKIKGTGISDSETLAITLQVIFLTIARDHGILGLEEIDNELKTSNWDKLFEKCKERFNSNIFEIKRPKKLPKKVLDSIYKESKRLDFSLRALPIEYVGDIYETLLHFLNKNEPKLSKTSYYTPEWLVKDIVKKLNPKSTDKILDPTCGSAAFLSYAFEYITKDLSFNQAKKILKNNIFGVDRDPLAVQVSRFSLLASLARKVETEWKKNEHLLPILTKQIVCEDFFNFKINKRFDVALGNPPWGSIDIEVPNKKIKKSLEAYKVYCDKTDISIYIIEKSFNYLSKNGRMGFLTKRATLDGEKHKNFRRWWGTRVNEVWDFEAEELFAPRNKEYTAVIFGNIKNSKKTEIISKSKRKIKNLGLNIEGKIFSEYFYCFKGAEPTILEIYKKFAEKYPKNKYVKVLAKTKEIRNGNIVSNLKAAFIHPNILDKDISNTFINWAKSAKFIRKKKGEQKKLNKAGSWWLKNRAEVIRNPNRKGKRTLAWLWFNGLKHYVMDDSQTRIIIPRFLNGERMSAALDVDGKVIPLDTTTVLIPRNGIEMNAIFFVVGWLNSTIFVKTEAHKGKLMGNEGRAMFPNYIKKMKIPEISISKKNEIIEIVKSNYSSGFNQHELRKIDQIFEKELKRIHARTLTKELQQLKPKKLKLKKVRKISS